MIFDLTNLFSDAQAITADAASTNIIDLGPTGTPYGSPSALARDIGPGTSIPLFVGITETFNNLTSMAVQVQTDDNAGFSTPTIVYTSPTYVLAELAVGAKFMLPEWLPTGTKERYVRLFYDITGTAPTTGKVTAGVVMGRQTSYGRY